MHGALTGGRKRCRRSRKPIWSCPWKFIGVGRATERTPRQPTGQPRHRHKRPRQPREPSRPDQRMTSPLYNQCTGLISNLRSRTANAAR